MNDIMHNIAICDDEIQIGKLLKQKLVDYSMHHNVDYNITLFQEGMSLLQKLEAGEPFDLIFLDVQMPGLNGIEVASEIRKINKDVMLVFLSSYKEYVFESFKVQAFRYLLKPLKDEAFKEVMDAVYEQYGIEERLEYSFQNEHFSINYRDILYIEGMRGKIWLHCKKQQTYRWRGALSTLAEELKTRGFFLIHRSYLINMKKIIRYNSQEVIMEDGQSLPISKHRYNEFRKEYILLWGETLPFN